jgi:hypothetical protein
LSRRTVVDGDGFKVGFTRGAVDEVGALGFVVYRSGGGECRGAGMAAMMGGRSDLKPWRGSADADAESSREMEPFIWEKEIQSSPLKKK